MTARDPTFELPAAEPLSGARLRATIERIRLRANSDRVVKFTPDAALALADLVEVLALSAGIDLPDSSEPPA